MTQAQTNPNKLTPDEKSIREKAKQRKARRKNRGHAVKADWGDQKSELVLRLIEVVSAIRGTVTFGYTKDGGAFYLSYFVDGEAEKVYIRPTEDVSGALQHEIESWE